ncbi:MAG: hypothetical protein GZ089_01775 [Aromatoleum sp.]|nr:hypothetical protein [Aromatoleum sp.]
MAPRDPTGAGYGEPRELLGWLVAAIIVSLYVGTLVRYSVNFPNADDFGQILAVPHYFAAKSTLAEQVAYVFSLSVEHRIATLRLAALIETGVFGGLNFSWLMFTGGVLLACAGALVVMAALREDRALLAGVAAALLFSPANHEAQFWATGALQHFGVIAWAFGALYCLGRGGAGWSVAALALALTAAFTSANGLMTFPAAAVMLWATGRRRAALSWAALTILMFAVYFIGYERPEFQKSALGTLLDPLVLLRFFLAALGSLAVHLVPAIVVGAALSAIWVWLILNLHDSVSPVLLGWFGFLVLSYAAMAVGRASFGDEGALLSRYCVYSEMAALITLVAVLDQVGPITRERILWTALPITLAWFAANWQATMPVIAHDSIVLQNRLDHYAADGHADYGAWPPAEYGDYLLGQATLRGYFDPTRIAHPSRRLIADDRELRPSQPSPVRLRKLMRSAGAISVFGYMPDSRAQVFMWLADGEHHYRASLVTMPGVRTPMGGEWGFFSGTVTTASLAPGRYRVGYTLGDESPATVYWSEEWVTTQ